MDPNDFIPTFDDYEFEYKVRQITERLHQLFLMGENGQTNYSGADLNILEKIQEKIANETITQEDILEIEKLAFRFL